MGSFRNRGATGTVDVDPSGLKIAGVAITPSAADFNHLLAADANGLVANDFLKLALLTPSAADFNHLLAADANGLVANDFLKLALLTPSAADFNHLLAADANGLVAADITKLAAVTVAAAAINLLTQGVAGGYKIARGVVTPSTASEAVVTGLATVVSVVVSLQDLPTLTMMFASGTIGDQAGSPAAGSFTLVTKKPTGTGDVTPIDSTTPWGEVNWIAIGT